MYTQAITRKHRSVFILLIDRSASMQERVCMGNRLLSKAQALTIIANNFLRELIDRCRRTDTLRDYYDIAVIGYGDRGRIYANYAYTNKEETVVYAAFLKEHLSRAGNASGPRPVNTNNKAGRKTNNPTSNVL